MIDERFRIYVDRLSSDEEEIQEEVESTFLQGALPDLNFTQPVDIQGVAYMADHTLVLTLSASTQCQQPCKVCLAPVFSDVETDDVCHVIEPKDLKSGVYNFQKILREDILLATPEHVECNGGNCPERSNMQKYLK